MLPLLAEPSLSINIQNTSRVIIKQSPTFETHRSKIYKIFLERTMAAELNWHRNFSTGAPRRSRFFPEMYEIG